jgi:hypothetical protein
MAGTACPAAVRHWHVCPAWPELPALQRTVLGPIDHAMPAQRRLVCRTGPRASAPVGLRRFCAYNAASNFPCLAEVRPRLHRRQLAPAQPADVVGAVAVGSEDDRLHSSRPGPGRHPARRRVRLDGHLAAPQLAQAGQHALAADAQQRTAATAARHQGHHQARLLGCATKARQADAERPVPAGQHGRHLLGGLEGRVPQQGATGKDPDILALPAAHGQRRLPAARLRSQGRHAPPRPAPGRPPRPCAR